MSSIRKILLEDELNQDKDGKPNQQDSSTLQGLQHLDGALRDEDDNVELLVMTDHDRRLAKVTGQLNNDDDEDEDDDEEDSLSLSSDEDDENHSDFSDYQSFMQRSPSNSSNSIPAPASLKKWADMAGQCFQKNLRDLQESWKENIILAASPGVQREEPAQQAVLQERSSSSWACNCSGDSPLQSPEKSHRLPPRPPSGKNRIRVVQAELRAAAEKATSLFGSFVYLDDRYDGDSDDDSDGSDDLEQQQTSRDEDAEEGEGMETSRLPPYTFGRV